MRWKTLISAQTLRFGLLASPAVLVGCPAPVDLDAPEAPEVSAALDVIGAFDSLPGVEEKDTSFKIQSVNPTIGTTDGDRIALIRGSGFVPGMSVHFGDQEAKEVTFISDSMMTAVVPVHEAGTVDVTLATRGADGEQAETAISNAFTFVTMPPDDGTDSDGDGLTDVEEQIVGYRVRVDFLGLGMNPAHLAKFNVNSDPLNPDTDGDGLLDNEEYFARTNPRSRDTDMDGLWDQEEAKRWLTSPISIDSDGDARAADPSTDRSTIPPVFDLFDGLELYTASELSKHPSERTLKLNATSPTLDDTDGDGVTDFEEIDTPVRTPLLADMPQLQFEIVDDIDVRLDVEYAEEQGTTTAFETSFTTAQSRSISQSQGNTVSASVTIGAEVSVGTDTSGSASIEGTAGFETSWETTAESARSAEFTVAEFQEKARTNTEVAATGSIATGVKITNTGNVTVQVTDMVHTVRQWQPNNNPDTADVDPGSYRTLAALAPDLGPGLTLAPGADSGVLLAEASDLNADRVKELLRRPDSLQVEPAAFELVSTNGINYAFIDEVTQARTARLSIDFGDGRFEEYRIATNVDRNADSSLAGLPLARALDIAIGSSNWEMGELGVPCGGASNLIANGSFELPDIPADDAGVNEVPEGWLTLLNGSANASLVESADVPAVDGDQWVSLNATPNSSAAIYQQIGAVQPGNTYTYSLIVGGSAGDDFTVSLWAGDPQGGGTIVDEDVWSNPLASEVTINGSLDAAGTPGEPLYLMIAFADPPVETNMEFDAVTVDGPRQLIRRIRDETTDLAVRRFWSVFLSEGVLAGSTADSVVLRNGDTVLLSLTQDQDNDGLYAAQEQQYGTSDLSADSDGDGISDPAEATRVYADGLCGRLNGGWTVSVTERDGVTVNTYRVFSDPRRTDADNDGLDDLAEKNQGSDPTLADTDGDGLRDDLDPAPTIAARNLFVRPTGSDQNSGLTWTDALQTVSAAISLAETLNNPNDQNVANDISEIWVAAGDYALASADLPNLVTILGGFAGNETRVGQRIVNPLANDTRLQSGVNPAFWVTSNRTSWVDGFTFDGSTNRAVEFFGSGSNVTFANCLFVNNSAELDGGAVRIRTTGPNTFNLLDCIFSNNELTVTGGTPGFGGAVAFQANNPLSALNVRRCTFVSNRCNSEAPGNVSGGAIGASAGATTLQDCIFRANRVVNATEQGIVDGLIRGGAVSFRNDAKVTIDGCRFENNEVDEANESRTDIWTSRRAGGAIHMGPDAIANIQNSVFVGNRAPYFAGAIYVEPSVSGRTRVLNCSFTQNAAVAAGFNDATRPLAPTLSATPFAIGGAIGSEGNTSVENSVFWDNTGRETVDGIFTAQGLPPLSVTLFTWQSELQVAVGPEIRRAGGLITTPSIGSLAISNSAINNVGQRIVNTSAPGEFNLVLLPSNAIAEFGINILTPTQPGFVSLGSGNLRLSSSSPLIDAGETVVDGDILQAGFQALPMFDFDVNTRLVDGDGDGEVRVDIGAFEYQGE